MLDDGRPLLDGRYVLGPILGTGGMATVHQARDIKVGRAVALKLLHTEYRNSPEMMERLVREGRVAAAIGHPNVCEVSDIGMSADSPYLVMERLHGESLSEHLKANRSGLAIDDIVDVLTQVLSALALAHEMGIVHRDLKPANLFLSRVRGRRPLVKVLDFGLALVRGIPEVQHEPTLTQHGTVLGTPAYMAPEQVSAEGNLDGRTDLYACGVILYQALTGRRPFTASPLFSLFRQIATESPRPAREIRPEIPEWLGRVIERAMSRDRVTRYQTADEFLRDLNSGEALATPGHTKHEHEPRRTDRWEEKTTPYTLEDESAAAHLSAALAETKLSPTLEKTRKSAPLAETRRSPPLADETKKSPSPAAETAELPKADSVTKIRL